MIAAFDATLANPLYLTLGVPATSAVVLFLIPGFRRAAQLNILASLVTFSASVALLWTRPPPNDYLFVDDFNIYLVLITNFVCLTTSVFSVGYLAHELQIGRLRRPYVRFYHAMFQGMALAMNLAFVSNSLGLMWVAVETATLATVVIVGLYRTEAAIKASWKYFILASMGISLALFGTTLLYFTAQSVIGSGNAALAWTVLHERAAELDPAVLNITFVFILVGYGTKTGLVPMHAWLPDAHSEGPTPISAVLSGLMLNLGLYALLRFKMLMGANEQTISPGPLMMGLGLASLLFGALMLYGRRDIKRLFAYSSIEHMGLITFAFGLGGPLANLAGILHMVFHSLTKSAIFFTVGHIAQVKGTQELAGIRGLTTTHPVLGWFLVLGVVVISGLPPAGLFMSEFLLVSTTFAREPLLAVPLVLGLLIALGCLIQRVQAMAFGDPVGETGPFKMTVLPPLAAHLFLVVVAGLYIPAPLFAWFQHVAALLG